MLNQGRVNSNLWVTTYLYLFVKKSFGYFPLVVFSYFWSDFKTSFNFLMFKKGRYSQQTLLI
jgi:hypothetical protein